MLLRQHQFASDIHHARDNQDESDETWSSLGVRLEKFPKNELRGGKGGKRAEPEKRHEDRATRSGLSGDGTDDEHLKPTAGKGRGTEADEERCATREEPGVACARKCPEMKSARTPAVQTHQHKEQTHEQSGAERDPALRSDIEKRAEGSCEGAESGVSGEPAEVISDLRSAGGCEGGHQAAAHAHAVEASGEARGEDGQGEKGRRVKRKGRQAQPPFLRRTLRIWSG
jgi:hypothetical protein